MHRPTLDRSLRFLGCVALAAFAIAFHALSGESANRVANTPGPAFTSRMESKPGGHGDRISVIRRGRTQPDPVADRTMITLASGIRFDTRMGEPPLPDALRGDPGSDAAGYFIVQFAGPIEAEWKADLESLGGRIHAYLPHDAFLVRLPAGARETIARMPRVEWTGAYHPAYKLAAAPEMAPGRRGDSYVLQVFDGEPADIIAARIATLGGNVVERSRGRNQLIRFQAGSDILPDLARETAVAWIEPWHPNRIVNSNAQWVVQTWVSSDRRIWDLGIRGEGQMVSTADSGIRTTHNQFRDPVISITGYGQYPDHRKLVAYVKTNEDPRILFGDESGHGTHTGCTVAGDDSPFATDLRDGMAPAAQLYFCDGGGSDPVAIYVPIDLNDLLVLPYTGNAAGGARIMSNSWSRSAAAGDYDFQAMTVDQFMWEHPDFLPFFADGNSGGTGTVGSPATAKNCVSAGGTGNGTAANTIYSSTSGGPADDGRLKPTVCAPAVAVSSAFFSGDASYASLSGTSMATPAMAGAAALMRQYLTEGWYPTGAKVPANGFTPSAALLKAMVVNSGDNSVSGYSIPSNRIGWGRVLTDNVLYFAGDTRRTALVDFTTGLLTGEYVEFAVEVTDATQPIEATLVWTDYPSTPAAAINLVNNLDLIATEPGGAVYRGNFYAAGQSSTGGTADAINVEECVQRNLPSAGTWILRVEAANVPFGPQPFALVVTGGLASGLAVVELNQAAYGAEDTVAIRVTDPDAALPLTVSVSSTTESTPEVVSLDGGDGIFTGAIPISLAAPAADGRIQVSNGDEITVTYLDPNPIAARATVNLLGPVITAVHAGNQSQDGATITWLTSTPASSRVYYGTTPLLGAETELEPALVTTHAVTITGLATNQTYYFDVESVDHQGNGVRDDAGGVHYRFTTDSRRDVLVVITDSSFDKRGYYETALSSRGWAHAIWEGALASPPRLGNLDSGLRSFKAVVWQPGLEQYPVITDAARDTLTALNAGGARWAIFSHDVAWDFSEPSSPDYSPARKAWFETELKAIWQADPATWSSVLGIAGDPISGTYTAGIPYTPHRSGAAGDEINPNPVGGTALASWRNNDTSPDDIAIRFTGAMPAGDPGSAVWGGQPTKISTNFYEWAHLNAVVPDDEARADILDRTLIWLIGHDHPDVTVTGPDGGEVITSGPVAISWTESAAAGFTVASRTIHVSSNGGESWNLVAAAPGPPPYSWNPAGFPNGTRYRIRVAITDNGSPSLRGRDDSNGDLTLHLPGGDLTGPVVVAGSIAVDPLPIRASEATSLAATVTDANTGGSNILAAEWSAGLNPAPAGTGTAMTGDFGTITVGVMAEIPAGTFGEDFVTLWVRAKDQGGAWGGAASLRVPVNAGPTGIGSEASAEFRFGLDQNAPNPFNPATTIRFTLESEAPVALTIFDVAGRAVRSLVSGQLAGGTHVVAWDGRDERGAPVASGIYLYKLVTPDRAAVRKMVLLQ